MLTDEQKDAICAFISWGNISRMWDLDDPSEWVDSFLEDPLSLDLIKERKYKDEDNESEEE